uniref:Uncharacterized protein n=1 Tax=Chromera velia CCMP2878 TaxID=1169474 RepID=A0A0G4G1J6_9ALVE|mmetsp:Transcript_5378/g.10642  ORF Transcript_5378/g.10642 Transcript_5378/m.10642 type:complete len:616 (+) Transcript_5378:188-2035(+)|eukprot:Cvel_19658.t1-p1 / transcript=Cvel_19658.t1 / gene=Cvel_19658 / organism=Chromera_velia_CCMP2878 / gene_product=hypothetical protein / transcript_product=hypothetical protein / location=Cvel_scaffold1713:34127-38902(-) / protein_length=615 / sequence_SO=supercontig / SO=protein_coding / is_pseudo=false
MGDDQYNVGVLRLSREGGSDMKTYESFPGRFGEVIALYYETVDNLTVDDCVKGELSFCKLAKLKLAIKRLQNRTPFHAPLLGIVGEEPALLRFQCAARFLSSVPVFMSSLQQCSAVSAAFKMSERILILSANASHLFKLKETLFKENGVEVEDAERFKILGFEKLKEFRQLKRARERRESIDVGKMKEAMMQYVRSAIEEGEREAQGKVDGKIKAVVLDTAELGLIADPLRKTFKIPVFGILTLLKFFRQGTHHSHWNRDTYSPHNPGFFEAHFGKVRDEQVEGECQAAEEGRRQGERDAAEAERERGQAPLQPQVQVTGPGEGDATPSSKKVLGVLRIDYSYPPAVGDVDHPESYDYEVVFETVHGLTFEKCQSGVLEDWTLLAFQQAVGRLQERPDLVGITGDCGFMMHYQCAVRHIARVPVFMSALVQSPIIASAFKNEEKILVLTANSETLLPAKDLLLTSTGIKINDPTRFHVEGLQDLDGFEAVALAQEVDTKKVKEGIARRVKEIVARDPAIKAILLECTELPHYSDALRLSTGLPVFDAITCINFFRSAAITSDWAKTYSAHNDAFWQKRYAQLGTRLAADAPSPMTPVTDAPSPVSPLQDCNSPVV